MNTHLNPSITCGGLAGLVLALTLLAAPTGLAAPLPDPPAAKAVTRMRASALAQNHWQAIAAGDVARVMTDYGPAPILHWDGGAFDGDYVGAPALQTVWSQFARLRAPLQLQVSDLREQRGGGESRIVTAYVVFRSHVWTYDVAYRLVFRQGLIVEETWRFAEPGDGPVLNEPA